MDFPSYLGIIEEYTDRTEAMDTSTLSQEVNGGGDTTATATTNGNGQSAAKAESRVNKRYLLDPMSYRTPRPNMQVQSFLKDGLINDWDLFEKVLDFTFIKYLRCDPSQHPVLFTEPVVSFYDCFLYRFLVFCVIC